MYGIIGLPSDWLGLIRFRDRRDLRSPGVAEGPQRSPRMVTLSSVRTMVATVDTAVGCRPTHRAKSNATRTRSPGRSTASFTGSLEPCIECARMSQRPKAWLVAARRSRAARCTGRGSDNLAAAFGAEPSPVPARDRSRPAGTTSGVRAPGPASGCAARPGRGPGSDAIGHSRRFCRERGCSSRWWTRPRRRAHAASSSRRTKGRQQEMPGRSRPAVASAAPSPRGCLV